MPKHNAVDMAMVSIESDPFGCQYDRSVIEWISSRKEKLLDLWTMFQSGGEPSVLIASLDGDA